jgi:hypothetical protein
LLRWKAGLPDGMVFKPKIPIWVNFGRSCKEDVSIFWRHFVYITAKWYILWPLGKCRGYLVYCFPVLYRKNLATLLENRIDPRMKDPI